MKVIEINPLTKVTDEINALKAIHIFLAGTIDCGNSEDWQAKYINYLREKDGDSTIIVYNPRRPHGHGLNSDNTEEMNFQVNWELDHLESADIIIMNILGNSKSPITLMELGLFASSGKLKVYCPKEFYRYDNVRIVCERYGVPLKEKLLIGDMSK